MQLLKSALDKIEVFLRNPNVPLETQNKEEIFDFNLLTETFGQKLPEGFEVGVFTSTSGENLPAFLPFSEANGIAFSIDRVSDFAFFNELLEFSTFKILIALGSIDFKITLIDGKNHGIYFNYLSQLDETITGGKIYKTSEEINKVLNNIFLQDIKKYHFILINNFPQGFTSESSAALIKILGRSDKGEIKVLMTKENEPPISMADLDSSISNKLEVISFDKNNHWFSKTLFEVGNINDYFKLNFGSSICESDIRAEVEVINMAQQSTKASLKVDFNVDEGIKIPFGKYKENPFYFRLGHGATNYHAIVGGRSGKGKTIFLDNLIIRGSKIYTPDELRFVLIDMKGVEFNDYRHLPHVQAFCSSTNFDDAFKVVEFLQEELKIRELLFNSVSAKNIVDYKQKSGVIMPRLLVIIDEFQNLFTGNYKSDGLVEEILIKQILRIGRAYGVHLICCTQSLGDGVRSSFLNNIPLRIAFQMTPDQSRSFLSISNSAAETLNVGEAIYNEQDGRVSENILVKIDFLRSIDVQKQILDFFEKGEFYQTFKRLIIEK